MTYVFHVHRENISSLATLSYRYVVANACALARIMIIGELHLASSVPEYLCVVKYEGTELW
jgi:hypothetical protein